MDVEIALALNRTHPFSSRSHVRPGANQVVPMARPCYLWPACCWYGRERGCGHALRSGTTQTQTRGLGTEPACLGERRQGIGILEVEAGDGRRWGRSAEEFSTRDVEECQTNCGSRVGIQDTLTLTFKTLKGEAIDGSFQPFGTCSYYCILLYHFSVTSC